MHKTNRGSALLLTTILLFVVLSLVVSLSYVTVMEQQMSSKTKSSVGSFFKADSGVEWALNKISNISGDLAIGSASAFNDTNIADGVACPEGFGCTLYFLDENGKVITTGATSKISDIKAVRAVGTQTTGDPTQRAVEAAVAGTGGGKYQTSCSMMSHMGDNDPGAEQDVCCRVDTSTGDTQCKFEVSHPPYGSSSWHNFSSQPSFTTVAGGTGKYQISASFAGGSWGWNATCCLTDTGTGNTQCKTFDGVSNNWSNFSSQPF